VDRAYRQRHFGRLDQQRRGLDQAIINTQSADVEKQIHDHQTFESWVREGREPARRAAYLNGELKVAASTARRIVADADVPTAPGG
jgi:hypothetical protein